jgi:hypothetical protein
MEDSKKGKPGSISQNENKKAEETPVAPKQVTRERPEVITVRNWKEYLGESLLIIFSVFLALFLTERVSKLREEREAKQVLHQLREELIDNKNAVDSQYQYHLQVVQNINAALANPALAQQFINNSEINPTLSPIAPRGVLIRDLNDVAWQLAKQTNVFSKIDLSTYGLLTDIYNNQQRITKTEDEIGRLLLSYDSRKPENLRTTLILMRDNYRAWAVSRAPRMLNWYESAIDKLKDY